MDKKQDILKGYDDIVEGKKNGRLAMRLITATAIIISLSALTYSFLAQVTASDKVKVVDARGLVINSELKNREDVKNASIQAHLANAVHYLNSFDRNSIKDNQAKAMFLVDKKSADRVFNSYNNQGAYNDAVRNNYIYNAEFSKLTRLEGQSEPYLISFEAILTVKDGSRQIKSKIRGQGKISYTKPSFPNNTQGMILYDYLQEFSDMEVTNEPTDISVEEEQHQQTETK